MAKNYVQPGDELTLTAPRDLSSGDPVLVGNLFGVALADATSGTDVDVAVEGVFDIAKAAGALSQGDLVYYDATNHVVTNTSNTGANKLVGSATKAAAGGDATARVRLNETTVS